MNKIIIMGATSGIGYKVAQLYIQQGWTVGIAGRRIDPLKQLQSIAPGRVYIRQIDITEENAPENLLSLITEMGGVDIYLHGSGIGKQNKDLDISIELATIQTNGEGFIRMVDTVFNYFKETGKGHICVISSIAGTKGLGAAAAYSATKQFQNTYIDALSQLSRMEKIKIGFTDIRPGFVDTPLLQNKKYPVLMDADYVAHKVVKAIRKKKRIAIIDWRYKIAVFFWRLIPLWIWERLPIRN